MPRNNILLRELFQTKLVQLPNGRTFYARYERTSRRVLNPTNVRIQQMYIRKIGPRYQQKRRERQGRHALVDPSMVMSDINLAKRGANTDLGKMIRTDAIDFVPTAYTPLKYRLFKKNVENFLRHCCTWMVDILISCNYFLLWL